MSKQPNLQPDRGEQHDEQHHQGIIRDQLGQEQPVDRDRAQQVNRQDQDQDPAGGMPKR